MNPNRRTTSVLGAAATACLALLALTSCSAPAPTKAEACDTLTSTIASVNKQQSTAMSQAATDPAKAAATLKKIPAKLHASADDVKGSPLESRASAAATAADAFIPGLISTLEGSPKADSITLQKTGTAVAAALSTITKECAAS